eukprot:m.189070 g.189070  ORF g.189070 m.189070 type:complete len:314 (-) comp10561_c0_seq12:1010-1951(-)
MASSESASAAPPPAASSASLAAAASPALSARSAVGAMALVAAQSQSIAVSVPSASSSSSSTSVVPSRVISGQLAVYRPQGPPPPRRKRKVLEEDDYVAAIEKIVERDFFPGLTLLKAQHEYLEALEDNDYERLRGLSAKYNTPLPPGASTPACDNCEVVVAVVDTTTWLTAGSSIPAAAVAWGNSHFPRGHSIYVVQALGLLQVPRLRRQLLGSTRPLRHRLVAATVARQRLRTTLISQLRPIQTAMRAPLGSPRLSRPARLTRTCRWMTFSTSTRVRTTSRTRRLSTARASGSASATPGSTKRYQTNSSSSR